MCIRRAMGEIHNEEFMMGNNLIIEKVNRLRKEKVVWEVLKRKVVICLKIVLFFVRGGRVGDWLAYPAIGGLQQLQLGVLSHAPGLW